MDPHRIQVAIFKEGRGFAQNGLGRGGKKKSYGAGIGLREQMQFTRKEKGEEKKRKKPGKSSLISSFRGKTPAPREGGGGGGAGRSRKKGGNGNVPEPSTFFYDGKEG